MCHNDWIFTDGTAVEGHPSPNVKQLLKLTYQLSHLYVCAKEHTITYGHIGGRGSLVYTCGRPTESSEHLGATDMTFLQ